MLKTLLGLVSGSIIPRQSWKMPVLQAGQDFVGNSGTCELSRVSSELEILGVPCAIESTLTGPTVTTILLRPLGKTRWNRLSSMGPDLAARLGVEGISFSSPFQLQIPNRNRAMVPFAVDASFYDYENEDLPLFIGISENGKRVKFLLEEAPHLLVGGTTGSGKSVCINSIIACLMATRPPDRVRFVLIDPKQVEFAQFEGAAHLACPIITETKSVPAILEAMILEMEKRYGSLKRAGYTNLKDFNRAHPGRREGRIVIVIDELADLILQDRSIETQLVRLAQKGRAAGIHLVAATQKPLVTVVTSLLKANMPTRIALMVQSHFDSLTILDAAGAENLLGNGDLLFQSPGFGTVRCQGPFIGRESIREIINHWRKGKV